MLNRSSDWLVLQILNNKINSKINCYICEYCSVSDNVVVKIIKTKRPMNIFVSNLPFKLTEAQLKTEFEKYGDVSSVKIITDRESGRSKGFGFVEMPEVEDANEAIKDLNGSDIDGRNIVVNEARPRE